MFRKWDATYSYCIYCMSEYRAWCRQCSGNEMQHIVIVFTACQNTGHDVDNSQEMRCCAYSYCIYCMSEYRAWCRQWSGNEMQHIVIVSTACQNTGNDVDNGQEMICSAYSYCIYCMSEYRDWCRQWSGNDMQCIQLLYLLQCQNTGTDVDNGQEMICSAYSYCI